MTDKKGKKTGWFHKALLVIVSLITIIVIIFYFGFWRVPDRTEEAEALLREHEEMVAKMSTIAPEENAWTYYDRAAEKLDLSLYEKRFENFGELIFDVFFLFKKYRESDLMEVTGKEITVNKNSLDQVDLGFRKDSAFIQVAPDKAIHWRYVYGRLSGFLILTGVYEAQKGRPMEAAGRYLEVIRMGDSYFRYYGLEYPLGGNTENAIFRLQLLLNSEKENRKLLEFVLENLKKNEEFDTLKPMMAKLIEMLKENYAVHNLTGYNNKNLKEFFQELIYEKNYERERLVKYYTMMTFLDYTKKPYPQAISAIEGSIKVRTPFDPIDSSEMYLYKQVYLSSIFYRTNLNALKLQCALHLYRLDNGKYPDTLSLLSPKYLEKIPGDQFSPGGKYVYKKRNDGSVILYSIGMDMKDDGGQIFAGKAEENGDLVFFDSSKNQ